MFGQTLLVLVLSSPLVASGGDSITRLQHLVEQQSQQIQALEADVKRLQLNQGRWLLAALTIVLISEISHLYFDLSESGEPNTDGLTD